MKGVISRMLRKDWEGRVLFTIQLQGDSTYYNMGTDDPGKVGAGPGAYVSFETSQDARGRTKINKGSLKVLRNEPAAVHTAPAVRGSANSRDKYWEDKEARDIETQKKISIQACRNSALAAVDIIIKNELVKLPSVVGKRLEVFNQLVAEYTTLFLEDTGMRLNGESDTPAVSQESEEAVPENGDDGNSEVWD